jgi:hypothetical protein
MSITNAINLFKVLSGRKPVSGPLDDPVLQRTTQMDWEETKSSQQNPSSRATQGTRIQIPTQGTEVDSGNSVE